MRDLFDFRRKQENEGSYWLGFLSGLFTLWLFLTLFTVATPAQAEEAIEPVLIVIDDTDRIVHVDPEPVEPVLIVIDDTDRPIVVAPPDAADIYPI